MDSLDMCLPIWIEKAARTQPEFYMLNRFNPPVKPRGNSGAPGVARTSFDTENTEKNEKEASGE